MFDYTSKKQGGIAFCYFMIVFMCRQANNENLLAFGNANME